MKIIFLSIFLILISQLALFADENVVEFRLAFEKKRANTEIIYDKDVGMLFVEKAPFLRTSDILKANLIIDNSNQPAWLELAVKSSGGTIIKPQIIIEILLKETGRNIIKQITSENSGNRTAVFIDRKCVMSPSIQGKIDNDRFCITTNYNENEAREIVDRINKNITN